MLLVVSDNASTFWYFCCQFVARILTYTKYVAVLRDDLSKKSSKILGYSFITLSILILISTAKCVDYQLSEDDISYAKSINEEMKNLDLEGFQKLTKHTEFLTGKLESSEKCEGCVSAVQEVSSKKHDIENGIIVFVSFSMPDVALKQLSDDASKYGATLVLRGIHQDSFLKTKDKILEINADGLHLNIDPELFDKYKIERVPTFVLMKKGREISRLSGNVTLSFAQEKLSTGEK